MKSKRFLPFFLFAGVLTGVYTFDLRKAWAEAPREIPAVPVVAEGGEKALR